MAVNLNKLFSYPVLTNYSDDYTDVKFVSESTKTLIKNRFNSTLSYVFDVDDETIRKLIANNRAKAILKVYCSSTKFRKIYDLSFGVNEIVLNNKDVNNRVELSSYIILTDKVNNYYSSNFNADYGTESFNLEKGSIIAIGSQENVFIEKDLYEFTKITSVIKVRKKDDDDDKGMEVEFSEDGHKIYVKLHKDDYVIYNQYAKHFLDVANSMIIVPAIACVLDMVTNECKEDNSFYLYEECKWFRVFKKKIEKIYNTEFNPTLVENLGSLAIAQKMIEYPLSAGLAWIRDNIDKRGEK